MNATVVEDMPSLGLKKGDEVTVIATDKKAGRVRIKWTDGQSWVDSWRVEVDGI